MLAIRLVLLLGGLFVWWPLLIVWLILGAWPHLVKDLTATRTIHVHHHHSRPSWQQDVDWLNDLK